MLPPLWGLLKTLVKLGLINLTHKTPLRGTIPPLEGVRLDHLWSLELVRGFLNRMRSEVQNSRPVGNSMT